MCRLGRYLTFGRYVGFISRARCTELQASKQSKASKEQQELRSKWPARSHSPIVRYSDQCSPIAPLFLPHCSPLNAPLSAASTFLNFPLPHQQPQSYHIPNPNPLFAQHCSVAASIFCFSTLNGYAAFVRCYSASIALVQTTLPSPHLSPLTSHVVCPAAKHLVLFLVLVLVLVLQIRPLRPVIPTQATYHCSRGDDDDPPSGPSTTLLYHCFYTPPHKRVHDTLVVYVSARQDRCV